MKFIDWFAGIGGFRRGMELAGHECVGFCEADKYATASYTSMHLITDEQREYLETLDLRKRQKEILKEEYRNGEWYANDIRRVYAGDIPRADCWCFGFPCQDISAVGEQSGFQGNRSSLFFRVMYLVGQLEEKERPEWLFIENVKNLLSINGGWDFAKLLCSMDEGGYDAEWQVLNSADFGVPQNRERCFIIGHHREKCSAGVFHIGEGSGLRNKTDETKEKVYETALCLTAKGNANWTGTFVVQDGKVRKLTPRECFRLQGWTDDYFEKAQFVNSDSQLYKQAGNGVTVNVIEAIARRFEDDIE